MSAQVMDTGSEKRSRKKRIVLTGILAFIVTAICAYLFCLTYSEYEIQSILNRQRDIQQAVLDKSLDAIRVWRVELVNQARFISSSEMFRMFITDTKDLPQQKLRELATPDALHSEDEATRALAEQRAYMQDLLRDFVRRRAWSDARIVSVNADDLLAPEYASALTPVQRNLAKEAVETKKAAFGPIHAREGSYFMDMADPLFEVLGVDEPKTVAVLLLSVPMDRPLTAFLTNSSGQEDVIYPRIVDQAGQQPSVILLSGNHLSVRPLDESISDGSLHFGLRHGLTALAASSATGSPVRGGEVYSLGSQPTLLNWLLVLETPAEVIDGRIHNREWEIYGLGALATIVITLIVAYVYAHLTSREYKRRAEHLAALYNTIRQQKLVLDGVNKSLQAGLLLVDDKGFIQIANPAFRKLTGAKEEDLHGLPLVDILPAKASVDLIGKMRNVIAENHSETMELSLPGRDGERLYRVTLFPYEAEKGESSSSGSGCVAIFQDITVFRANAKKASQRQEALLTAMDRAMESVDPNLVGQSAKMAAVSRMLADELNMDAAQKDTLRIAALLSQIGKLFVPRELLLKKGELTPDERREVGRAPEHADRILRDLHFDLPVRETVMEMGERLDGSGPAGYKGDQISAVGRVLGVVNAFIAMTSPRAWRSRGSMSTEEAIDLLYGDPRFDQATTEALAHLDKRQLKDIINKN